MKTITNTQLQRSDAVQQSPARGPIIELNPLEHCGWDSLLAANPFSCFFHSRAWCKVLHETYVHRPLYLSRIIDGALAELLPLMEVASPWTGRRGVSLPFTDACRPLQSAQGDTGDLYEAAKEQGRRRRWRYLEFRDTRPPWPGAFPSLSFSSHVVQLEAGPEAAFKNLEGAVRRGIRKAEAAGLQIEFSASLEAIRLFFKLHCGTRRRHGVPPQPRQFFENIARYVFAAGQGFVVTARLGQKPVAAAVFFHWRDRAIYKFGASDYRFQQLRPNNLVMWAAIKKFAAEGLAELDLGRTSMANEGLRRFKAGFGAREQRIEYCRYDLVNQKFVLGADRAEGRLNHLFRCLPSPLFRLAGSILYPHLS